ncbi:MAG: sulfurtransferase, partial [Ottowia sp.]|nr:sulfurtransferase [Ottowia sp.]
MSQPQIASVQALKGKRLYLPQQDSLRSCIARGMLDQARMSLKDLGKVEFQNTRGAGLNALGLGATDATVA